MINIDLPWPPSVNHYWYWSGKRCYIGKKGRAYNREVYYLSLDSAYHFTQQDRLSVVIKAYPPDRRKRDLDNILKCTLDSLEKAHVIPCDSQIDELIVYRKDELRGQLSITIQSIYA